MGHSVSDEFSLQLKRRRINKTKQKYFKINHREWMFYWDFSLWEALQMLLVVFGFIFARSQTAQNFRTIYIHFDCVLIWFVSFAATQKQQWRDRVNLNYECDIENSDELSSHPWNGWREFCECHLNGIIISNVFALDDRQCKDIDGKETREWRGCVSCVKTSTDDNISSSVVCYPKWT